MKILHLSNCYYKCGGDCTHLFNLMKILEKKGHKNLVFSMHHPQNIASEYSKYFVSYINYAEEAKKKSILAGYQVLSRAIYSFEARKKLELLVNEEQPDIAHVQSLHHHLTHSVLYSLKKHNIPIIWTLHDYAVICPNTTFLNHGRICEKCKKKKYYWPVINKCKKDSRVASALAAFETTLHRIMNISSLIDVYITPSEFLRNKLIEYGFSGEKIVCLNNFIETEYRNENIGEGDYYLFIGRLEREKGVKTLIDAALNANAGKLKILGDGTLKKELMSYIKLKDENANIEFLGHRSHNEVMKIIKNCRFVVLPSEWYENYPYAVLEAFACGKTVIGSRIGGIPELVKDNETGLTFETGNSNELSLKIGYLSRNPDKAREMGSRAKSYVERELNPGKHYQRLIRIYKMAGKT